MSSLSKNHSEYQLVVITLVPILTHLDDVQIDVQIVEDDHAVDVRDVLRRG